jgi:hypothetical protein
MLATLSEIIGAIVIAIGLAGIFWPLSFLWAGVCCFALSYLAQRRPETVEGEQPFMNDPRRGDVEHAMREPRGR